MRRWWQVCIAQTNNTSDQDSKAMTADVKVSISQIPLLVRALKALNMIAGLEVRPVLEADTALCVFAHFGNVLLDVLQ